MPRATSPKNRADSNGKPPKSRPAAAKLQASGSKSSRSARHRQRIAEKAYELYEKRGRKPGRALDDWLAAESEELTDESDEWDWDDRTYEEAPMRSRRPRRDTESDW